MVREKSCFFTGHRDAGEEFRGVLECAVLELINSGVDTFIAGGAVGFDMIAAETVLEIKADYPHIRLLLYLPCRNHSAKWSAEDCTRLDVIINNADEVRYITDGEYADGCMKRRNAAMVRDAHYCIAWFDRRIGGTSQTVAIANKCGCAVRNIIYEKSL